MNCEFVTFPGSDGQHIHASAIFCVALPQVLMPLTKVSIERQYAVIVPFFFVFIANARGAFKCMEIMLSLACLQLEETSLWSPGVREKTTILRILSNTILKQIRIVHSKIYLFAYLFQISKYKLIPFSI